MDEPYPRTEPTSWPLSAARAIAVAVLVLCTAALIQGVYLQAEVNLPDTGWRLAIVTAGMGVVTVGTLSVGLSLGPFVGVALVVCMLLVGLGGASSSGAQKTVKLATIVAWWLLGLTVVIAIIHFESVSDNAALTTAALMVDGATIAILVAATRWGRALASPAT